MKDKVAEGQTSTTPKHKKKPKTTQNLAMLKYSTWIRFSQKRNQG